MCLEGTECINWSYVDVMVTGTFYDLLDCLPWKVQLLSEVTLAVGMVNNRHPRIRVLWHFNLVREWLLYFIKVSILPPRVRVGLKLELIDKEHVTKHEGDGRDFVWGSRENIELVVRGFASKSLTIRVRVNLETKVLVILDCCGRISKQIAIGYKQNKKVCISMHYSSILFYTYTQRYCNNVNNERTEFGSIYSRTNYVNKDEWKHREL